MCAQEVRPSRRSDRLLREAPSLPQGRWKDRGHGVATVTLSTSHVHTHLLSYLLIDSLTSLLLVSLVRFEIEIPRDALDQTKDNGDFLLKTINRGEPFLVTSSSSTTSTGSEGRSGVRCFTQVE